MVQDVRTYQQRQSLKCCSEELDYLAGELYSHLGADLTIAEGFHALAGAESLKIEVD